MRHVMARCAAVWVQWGVGLLQWVRALWVKWWPRSIMAPGQLVVHVCLVPCALARGDCSCARL